MLTGPVHNSAYFHGPEETFYSPETAFAGLNGGQNGLSSGNGTQPDSSVDERGLELDGDGTEIQPVYHELANNEVGAVHSLSSQEKKRIEEDEAFESSPIEMAV